MRTSVKPWSRASCAKEALEVGEEPTTCTHCGTRTEILRDFTAEGVAQRLERCRHCGQQFAVTDAPDDPGFDPADPGEIEVVDERTGEVIGSTAAPAPGMSTRTELDELLAELGGGVPEAGQEDLNHLFGIKPAPPSPYGDDFGSFG